MQGQFASVGPGWGSVKRLGVVVGLFSLGCLPAVSGPIGANFLVVCSNGTNCTTVVSQTAPLSFSQAYQSSPSDPIINLTAMASENLSGSPSLHALNSYSEPSPTSFYTQVNVGAVASFTATIMATGSGYEVPVFEAYGTTMGGAGGQVVVSVNGAKDGTGMFFQGNAHLEFPIAPVVFGSPINVQYVLSADAFPTATHPTGSADYSHTLIFDGLRLFDSQMNPIDASISCDGCQVNTVTPEPGSILLLGLGLTTIGLLGRKRRV